MANETIRRLEDLEDLLHDLPGEPMGGSELDGFVAGLLVCPMPVPPGEWLPEVWDRDAPANPASPFETERQAKQATSLVMAHHTAVARALRAGRGHYAAIYDIDTRLDDTLWEIWIGGFARAMALRPASWDSIAVADPATHAALAGLRALIAIADRTSGMTKPEIDTLSRDAPDLIPTWIDDLHAWRTPRPAPTPGKTGRNDPCPCGSGKKYKKCCGAA